VLEEFPATLSVCSDYAEDQSSLFRRVSDRNGLETLNWNAHDIDRMLVIAPIHLRRTSLGWERGRMPSKGLNEGELICEIRLVDSTETLTRVML